MFVCLSVWFSDYAPLKIEVCISITAWNMLYSYSFTQYRYSKSWTDNTKILACVQTASNSELFPSNQICWDGCLHCYFSRDLLIYCLHLYFQLIRTDLQLSWHLIWKEIQSVEITVSLIWSLANKNANNSVNIVCCGNKVFFSTYPVTLVLDPCT